MPWDISMSVIFSNAFKKQFMINPSTLKKATHPLLHRKML